MKTFKSSLVVLDVLAMYVALVLAVLIRGTIHNREVQAIPEWVAAHTVIFLPSVIFAVMAIFIAGLYDSKTLYDRARVIPLLIYTQIATAVFSILFFYSARTELTPKLTLFLYVVLSTITLSIVRISFVYILNKFKKADALVVRPENAKYFPNLNPDYAPYTLNELSEKDFYTHAEEFFKKYDVLLYDVGLLSNNKFLLKLEELKIADVPVLSIQEYYESLYKKIDLSNFDFDYFKRSVVERKEDWPHFFFRRLLDVFSALLIFPIFILSLPFVWLINLFFNKGTLFSVQNRVGQLGKQVWVYKLRTMVTTDTGGVMTSDGKAAAHGQSKNEYTQVGKLWRKIRLDEFPQCINLLKGDISIIGPRADIIGMNREMSQFSDIYNLRLVVPQGLTGWAQVHMGIHPRTAEDHMERLAFDLYYIKHRSILLDISVILKTIKTMIAREGA